MALTQKEILDGIDHLAIYKKDYDNILMLLNNGDDKLFLKILEEVLEGNLFWSDIDQLLSNTDYQDILNDQLALQDKLSKEMSLLAGFRAKVRQSLKTEEFSGKTAIYATGPFYTNKNTALGLTRGDPKLTDDERDIEIYDKEYAVIRDNIIYELTKPNDKDNALSLAFKTKLENAIRNGEILLKKVNSHENVNYDEKYIYNGSTKYDYINPDDIFFYITNYIIPLDYRYQTLNDIDRDYMKRNNLTEKQMKEFKSLAAFYRRDMFYAQGEDSTNANP